MIHRLYANCMVTYNDFGPSGIDVQQVCLKGHIVTNYAESQPEYKQKFCTRCGAETVAECRQCQSPLQGFDHDSGVVVGYIVPPPAYCYNCGKPHSWTEQRLAAAADLVAEDESLSSEDKKLLTATFPDIASETPRTSLAVVRIKKLLPKAEGWLGEALRKALIDVMTETAKKAIWPHL